MCNCLQAYAHLRVGFPLHPLRMQRSTLFKNSMLHKVSTVHRPASVLASASLRSHNLRALSMGGLFAKPQASVDNFHGLSALDIDKNTVDFARFKGQVVLVSNVASK